MTGRHRDESRSSAHRPDPGGHLAPDRTSVRGSTPQAHRQAGARGAARSCGSAPPASCSSPTCGRCGQQRTDDREAQPRPAIPVQGIASNCHRVSQSRRRDVRHRWERSLQTGRPLTILNLCATAPPTTALGQRAQRRQQAQRLEQLGAAAVAANRASTAAGTTSPIGGMTWHRDAPSGTAFAQQRSVPPGPPTLQGRSRHPELHRQFTQPAARERPAQRRTEHHHRSEINPAPEIEQRARRPPLPTTIAAEALPAMLDLAPDPRPAPGLREYGAL